MVNWSPGFYANSLAEAALEATIWESAPPMPNDVYFEHDQPHPIATLRFTPDLDAAGSPAWSIKSGNTPRTFNSKGAAEYILKWWFKAIEKRQSLK
jgi:hypothetical protein